MFGAVHSFLSYYIISNRWYGGDMHM